MYFILFILSLILYTPALSATADPLLRYLEYPDRFTCNPEASHLSHMGTLGTTDERISYLEEQTKLGDVTAVKLLSSELKTAGRLKEASNTLVVYCLHAWMADTPIDEEFTKSFYTDIPRDKLLSFLQFGKYKKFIQSTFKGMRSHFSEQTFDLFNAFTRPFQSDLAIPSNLDIFSLDDLGRLAFRVMRHTFRFAGAKETDKKPLLQNFSFFLNKIDSLEQFDDLKMYGHSLLMTQEDVAHFMEKYKLGINHGFIYEKGHRRPGTPDEVKKHVWQLGWSSRDSYPKFMLGILTHSSYFTGTYQRGVFAPFSSEQERSNFIVQHFSLIHKISSKGPVSSGPCGIGAIYTVMGQLYEMGRATHIYQNGDIKVKEPTQNQLLDAAVEMYIKNLPVSSSNLAILLLNNSSATIAKMPSYGKIPLRNEKEKIDFIAPYLAQLTPSMFVKGADMTSYFLAQNTLGKLYASGKLEKTYDHTGKVIGRVKDHHQKMTKALEHFSKVTPKAESTYYETLVCIAEIYGRFLCLDQYQDGVLTGTMTSPEQVYDKISSLLSEIPEEEDNYQKAQTILIEMLCRDETDYLYKRNGDGIISKVMLENPPQEAYAMASKVNTETALFYRGKLILEGYGEFESPKEREKQAVKFLNQSGTSSSELYLTRHYLQKTQKEDLLSPLKSQFLTFATDHLTRAVGIGANPRIVSVLQEENDAIRKELPIPETELQQKVEEPKPVELSEKSVPKPEQAVLEKAAPAPTITNQPTITTLKTKPLDLPPDLPPVRNVEVRKGVTKFQASDAGYRLSHKVDYLLKQLQYVPDLMRLTDRKVAGVSSLFEVRLNNAYRMIVGLNAAKDAVVFYAGHHDGWQESTSRWDLELR